MSNIKSNNTNLTAELKVKLQETIKEEKIKQQEQQRQEKIHQNDEWMWELDYDKNGKLIKSLSNYIKLLSDCPDIGKFSFDTYTQRRLYTDVNGTEYEFTDSLYREFYQWSEQFICPCDEKKCVTAMLCLSDKNSYNSATERFDNLIWDGVQRLERFFIDLLGAEDTQLVREMTKLWMVGAIQRIYEPGCKNENVLILTGSQGCGKTSTLMWLAKGFGFDNNINLSRSEQEISQKLQQCWFVCFDELATLSKRESAEYKNWLSIQIDTYREPYARTPEKHPRHNVYCGTTNETNFLRDNSDRTERRMWVIQCSRTQKEWSEQYHSSLTNELWEQIWGEAIYLYKNTPDFNPYLPATMYDEFVNQQRIYKDYNSDVTELLLEYLNRPYYLDDNGWFEDTDDMLKQMKNIPNESYPNTTKQYINHIQQSYVSVILTELLHQKKVDHKCMRNVLDGQWCVKKNRKRMYGKNLVCYIRGEWDDMELDIEKEINRKYNDVNDGQSEQLFDNEDGLMF